MGSPSFATLSQTGPCDTLITDFVCDGVTRTTIHKASEALIEWDEYGRWGMAWEVGGGRRWQRSPIQFTSTHLCFSFSFFHFSFSCFIFHISKIYQVSTVWVPSGKCLIEQQGT
jgi:hypothetical protein